MWSLTEVGSIPREFYPSLLKLRVNVLNRVVEMKPPHVMKIIGTLKSFTESTGVVSNKWALEPISFMSRLPRSYTEFIMNEMAVLHMAMHSRYVLPQDLSIFPIAELKWILLAHSKYSGKAISIGSSQLQELISAIDLNHPSTSMVVGTIPEAFRRHILGDRDYFYSRFMVGAAVGTGAIRDYKEERERHKHLGRYSCTDEGMLDVNSMDENLSLKHEIEALDQLNRNSQLSGADHSTDRTPIMHTLASKLSPFNHNTCSSWVYFDPSDISIFDVDGFIPRSILDLNPTVIAEPIGTSSRSFGETDRSETSMDFDWSGGARETENRSYASLTTEPRRASSGGNIRSQSRSNMLTEDWHPILNGGFSNNDIVNKLQGCFGLYEGKCIVFDNLESGPSISSTKIRYRNVLAGVSGLSSLETALFTKDFDFTIPKLGFVNSKHYAVLVYRSYRRDTNSRYKIGMHPSTVSFTNISEVCIRVVNRLVKADILVDIVSQFNPANVFIPPLFFESSYPTFQEGMDNILSSKMISCAISPDLAIKADLGNNTICLIKREWVIGIWAIKEGVFHVFDEVFKEELEKSEVIFKIKAN